MTTSACNSGASIAALSSRNHDLSIFRLCSPSVVLHVPLPSHFRPELSPPAHVRGDSTRKCRVLAATRGRSYIGRPCCVRCRFAVCTPAGILVLVSHKQGHTWSPSCTAGCVGRATGSIYSSSQFAPILYHGSLAPYLQLRGTHGLPEGWSIYSYVTITLCLRLLYFTRAPFVIPWLATRRLANAAHYI